MNRIDPTRAGRMLTTRRSFLQVGYSGFVGLGLPGLLAARAASARRVAWVPVGPAR